MILCSSSPPKRKGKIPGLFPLNSIISILNPFLVITMVSEFPLFLFHSSTKEKKNKHLLFTYLVHTQNVVKSNSSALKFAIWFFSPFFYLFPLGCFLCKNYIKPDWIYGVLQSNNQHTESIMCCKIC